MKKLLLTTASFVALAASSAIAADLPIKAPVYRAAPVFSWTGCYVHGNVGYGIVGRNLVDYGEDVSYGSQYLSDWAFTVGGGVGCNYQTGNLVVGFEGDINWTSFDQGFTSNEWNTGIHRAKWDWYATLRTRFGLAVDRTLVYATAGVAAVKVNYESFYDTGYTCADELQYAACLKETQLGVVAGVGVEYAFTNNWSMKGEYLGIYLPTRWRADGDAEYSWTSYAQMVRYGLTYRWGESPVMARY